MTPRKISIKMLLIVLTKRGSRGGYPTGAAPPPVCPADMLPPSPSGLGEGKIQAVVLSGLMVTVQGTRGPLGPRVLWEITLREIIDMEMKKLAFFLVTCYL